MAKVESFDPQLFDKVMQNDYEVGGEDMIGNVVVEKGDDKDCSSGFCHFILCGTYSWLRSSEVMRNCQGCSAYLKCELPEAKKRDYSL